MSAGTHRRTCGVRTSRSSSLTCGPQTARTWIQSIALLEVPFNGWSINVDDSRQSTSWSRQSSLSGANCRSVSSMAPLVSGVTVPFVGPSGRPWSIISVPQNDQGLKSRPNFALFDPRKIYGAKFFSQFYEFSLSPDLWYTFGGAPLGHLGN